MRLCGLNQVFSSTQLDSQTRYRIDQIAGVLLLRIIEDVAGTTLFKALPVLGYITEPGLAV
ncbi:hypothetical protein AKJ21_08615 [Corynebacterium glutamicum]|nr:hypothetical protein AKJ21_08615 [Corynebacterium glutamicum]